MDSVVSEDHEYLVPKRAITSVEDMQIWDKSEAYFIYKHCKDVMDSLAEADDTEYLGFVMALNEAVKGKSLSVECPESDVTKGMVSLLDKLDVWIDETPPIEQPQRFGNQAFRTWYKKVKEGAMQLLQEALPERFHRAVPEIMLYLSEGFGNSTRIDYGTGHEMSFIMLMCCLFKIGSLLEEDKVAAVTRIFNRYLLLVRKLQLTYRMEPAGSHGVWSLDDYQFVPFIWGSSQLVAHPRIEPRSFLQADIVQSYAKDYMFISCIQFINKVKTGLFAEHSNQLWNISAVPSWTKINGGLIKMYKAEVLAKFPVIQHVLFGSLLPFKIVQRPQNVHNVRLNVTHRTPASFPVPSTTKTTNDTAAK